MPPSTRRRLTRRRFLSAVGATAAAAPFVPHLGAFAEGGVTPRLLLFAVPHFSSKYGWSPEGGTETAFELAEIMAPLAPFRDRLLIASGIDNTAAAGEGTITELHGHVTAAFGVHTGLEAVPGPNRGSTTGASFDQIAAARLGADTRFRSLELGVESGEFSVSATGPASPLPMEGDPRRAFERLFAGFESGATEPSAEALRRIRQRRSVLDFVAGNLDQVRGRVGASDRHRIDAHLTSVREIERTLEPAVTAAACAPPAAIDAGIDPDDVQRVGPLQVELAVAALACDLTRVATVQWGHHGGGMLFDFLGMTEDWHHYAHRAGGRTRDGADDAFIVYATWIAERFAEALAGLDAVDVGDGTLLDHTLVAWVAPPGHGTGRAAFLLAGGERLGLRTGRHLTFEGGRSNEMMLAMLHRLGLTDLEVFGDPAHCAGPIAGV